MEDQIKNEPVNEVSEEKPCETVTEPATETVAEQPDAIKQVEAKLDELTQKLSEASETVLAQVSDNRNKDALMNNMHMELQKYKANLYRKIMSPVIMQIIQLSDNIRTIALSYDAEPAEGELKEKYDKLRNEYTKLPLQISDIMDDFFVQSFEGKAGDVFDPKKQSVGGIKPCDNPEDDNKVVRSISAGYIFTDEDEFLIRREKVEINKYENNKPE